MCIRDSSPSPSSLLSPPLPASLRSSSSSSSSQSLLSPHHRTAPRAAPRPRSPYHPMRPMRVSSYPPIPCPVLASHSLCRVPYRPSVFYEH
eukprot:3544347-Rhodomonas_salina.1